MPGGTDLDMRVRLRAFECLGDLVRTYGDVLPSRVLWQGFEFEGQKVPLKSIQGIFKPAILPEMPLSITTAPADPRRPAPYDDGFSDDGSILYYRYRGTDPNHFQNVSLRKAMERRRPLIYFHGIVRAEYFAAWPVFVVADEPHVLRFHVAVDDAQFASEGLAAVAEEHAEPRRGYITVATRRRLHQRAFRLRVLHAYRERCALCRLRRQQLLDAAHILPDSDPRGAPTVSNGLALCKLHHAAFDQDLIGVRPDLTVEVRPDVLREQDGPMLIHGLQGFQGSRILVPRRQEDRPDLDFLEERYRRFRSSGG